MTSRNASVIRHIFMLIFLVAALAAVASAASVEERNEKAPAGTESYSFPIPVVVTEAEAYAGIQFGLTLSDEAVLSFDRFELSEATKTAHPYPMSTKNGVTTFGFFTMSNTNAYSGNLLVGTLYFTYTGTEPETITIRDMAVFRIDGEFSKRTNKQSPAYVIHVTRDSSSVKPPDVPPIIIDIPNEGPALAGHPDINPFEDVLADDWFYDDVLYVFYEGLMLGTSTEPMLFSPQVPISRAMAVTVLYRWSGSPDASGLPRPFPDTQDGTWYTDAVKWGAENGIILGYDNGNFGPNDPITREQLAAILLRYEQFSENTPPDAAPEPAFADQARIGDWAADAVRAMAMQGIMTGKPENRFDPQGVATRAELATVLRRLLDVWD